MVVCNKNTTKQSSYLSWPEFDAHIPAVGAAAWPFLIVKEMAKLLYDKKFMQTLKF